MIRVCAGAEAAGQRTGRAGQGGQHGRHSPLGGTTDGSPADLLDAATDSNVRRPRSCTYLSRPGRHPGADNSRPAPTASDTGRWSGNGIHGWMPGARRRDAGPSGTNQRLVKPATVGTGIATRHPPHGPDATAAPLFCKQAGDGFDSLQVHAGSNTVPDALAHSQTRRGSCATALTCGPPAFPAAGACCRVVRSSGVERARDGEVRNLACEGAGSTPAGSRMRMLAARGPLPPYDRTQVIACRGAESSASRPPFEPT